MGLLVQLQIVRCYRWSVCAGLWQVAEPSLLYCAQPCDTAGKREQNEREEEEEEEEGIICRDGSMTLPLLPNGLPLVVCIRAARIRLPTTTKQINVLSMSRESRLRRRSTCKELDYCCMSCVVLGRVGQVSWVVWDREGSGKSHELCGIGKGRASRMSCVGSGRVGQVA